MKKMCTCWRRQKSSSSGSSTSTGRSRVGDTEPGYHIRRKDLGKIHKAARVGNVEKVKQILLLGRNDVDYRDKMSRTALHLACACGHPAVVSLLADSKCLLNLCDLDNRTPLIKAVQCQQEECVAALLDRGADPNVMDIDGNTALHHAVLGESVAILEKLLLCNANMEVRNTDDLTPLSLAESEQKEQMMALLVKKGTEFEKMNRMNRPTSDNKGFKDTVISQTCSPTEKTPENQSKEIHLPPVYLEKMSQESEINRECDQDDISTYSGHPSVQTFVEGWNKQDKAEQRKNLQLIPNELKQNFDEICENYKCTACPEEKPLCDNSKEIKSLRQMPSTMTNNTSDCEGKDAFGMSVSAGFQTFPEQKEPTLRYVFSSNSDSGPLDDASSSFSKLCLNEKKLHSENNHKPDTYQGFNQNEETFYKGEEKKVRKSIRFELKEDQEFDMRMTKNMNPDTTNWKSGIGHTSESSDLQNHFGLVLTHCNQIKHTIQMRRRGISAVTNTHTHKKTKPKPDLLQKPLYVDSHSAGNCESMETEFEDASPCQPDSDRTPPIHVSEELQQDMQKCKDDIDMFKRELLASKKEKVQVQKEIEEERKKQKVSKMKVTKKIHKAAGEHGNGLIKPRDCERTDNQPFPLTENDNSDRTSEEICYEDYKVKEKINSMDDLDDLTQSTESTESTVSEPYSNCKNFILLIKEFCKDCKDPHSLYKIQGAVLSYERSVERGTNQCELLTKQVKIMEKSVRRLQRKLSETREIKSQLEHQKVELEGELCNLRLTLKEEKEKREKADLLSEEIKEQLVKIEEEFIKETEKNRELETSVRTLELKLKILLENSDQNDHLRAKLEAMSSKCLHLEVEKKSLQQELLSMKAIETQCAKLEDEKEKWKEKVVKLSRQMEMNMVEYSALEYYKLNEKRARQDAAEKLQQVQSLMQTHRESQEHNSSLQRQLELKNRDLESELLKTQTSLFFNNMKLDKYMALYQEESAGRKLLESKLNQTMEKVGQVNAELLRQKERNRDLLSTAQTMPVLQTPWAVSTNTNTSFVPSTQRTPRKRATFLTLEQMNEEFDKMVKKAVKEGLAEADSAYKYRRAHPVRSTDQSKSYDELILEANQEYTECLIKQCMPWLI